MGVSEKSGTPKSSILIGFSIIFTMTFLGMRQDLWPGLGFFVTSKDSGVFKRSRMESPGFQLGKHPLLLISINLNPPKKTAPIQLSNKKW